MRQGPFPALSAASYAGLRVITGMLTLRRGRGTHRDLIRPQEQDDIAVSACAQNGALLLEQFPDLCCIVRLWFQKLDGHIRDAIQACFVHLHMMQMRCLLMAWTYMRSL